MRKISYLFIFPILLLMGCAKDQNKIDDDIIKKYISDHHLNAIASTNGLYYVETQAGTGGSPTVNSTVVVNYTGYLTSGSIFDKTTTATGPATLVLNDMINGWRLGIPLMKKGGKATLLIPSLMGYAAQEKSGIPPNSVLIFDIELVNYY